ncbi:hypothetical protein [Bacillus phage vB_BanS-Thrax5]|nr:hypothetical protein [Bacillus phage vB_BanS-Thrax5]
MKTLKNGVQVVENGLVADFEQTQDMLNENSYTEIFDAESAYEDRPQNIFEKTYIVKIERQEDFELFTRMLKNESNCIENARQKELSENQSLYYSDKITTEKFRENRDEINERFKGQTCDCKPCNFRKPTYEEWKTGKYENRAKLGKTLKKHGFSQDVLDYYSLQIKEESEKCITISSLPQFIAGMSYWCELGEWDGYRGSSCQDLRHDDEDYALNIGGALHDNKLFIAMMHESVEDFEDFTDKMISRTLMRYVEIDGEPSLVACQYYGNNTTKNELDNALNKLNEVGIFGRNITRQRYDENGNSLQDNVSIHEESANGRYEYTVCDDVNVCETIEETIDIDCPMCEGSGKYEVYSNRIDSHVDIECPMCGGSKEYQVYVYEEIDEWKEVEGEKYILPYVEGYDHNGDRIKIEINMTLLNEIRNSFKVIA